jgi:hypothetical protein
VPHRERQDALKALIALDDPRLGVIAAALWPADLTRTAIMMLFPQHLSVEQLCKVLTRVREPRRSVGDLSWFLPKLITEKNFTAENLDKLHAGLTELVLNGAEWNNSKWPHTRTKRPDLIPSLLAVCNRQFREGVASPALFRSRVLTLVLLERITSTTRRQKNCVLSLPVPLLCSERPPFGKTTPSCSPFTRKRTHGIGFSISAITVVSTSTPRKTVIRLYGGCRTRQLRPRTGR